MLLQLLAAAAGTADPPGPGVIAAGQLLRAVRHRLPRRPGRLRDRGDPAVPRSPCHRPQHQPPRPLIQPRQQQLKLRPHTPDKIRVRAHQHILPPDTPKTHLKKGRVPGAGGRPTAPSAAWPPIGRSCPRPGGAPRGRSRAAASGAPRPPGGSPRPRRPGRARKARCRARRTRSSTLGVASRSGGLGGPAGNAYPNPRRAAGTGRRRQTCASRGANRGQRCHGCERDGC